MKSVNVTELHYVNKVFKKNQVDLFKNKLRTRIFSVLGGLLLHKTLEGKSQNEICNGYLVQFYLKSFLSM